MKPDGKRVEQLLRTSLWYLDPPGHSPYCRGAEGGEYATQRKRCGRCGGSGRVGRRIKYACPDCAGAGELLVDGYTERTPSEQVEDTRRARRTVCDSCGGDGVYG